jgi:putative endonuclease
MTYWVYILARRKHGTLYIGMTNNLARRIHEHREGRGSSFVQKYHVTRLVYTEPHEEVDRAIQREKTMKEWPRAWKIKKIESVNREWKDLYRELNR